MNVCENRRLKGDSHRMGFWRFNGRSCRIGFSICLLILLFLQCADPPAPTPVNDELHIAARGAISSPDPYLENSVVAFSVYSNIYEPLIGHDSDLKLRPVLASEWSNPDDLTWLITLRPGIHFSDGSRF